MKSSNPIKRRWLQRQLQRKNSSYREDPAAYWDTRHHLFGDDLRGVGYIGGDDDLNRSDYVEKVRRFEEAVRVCQDSGARTALDAGCGTGVFTRVLVDRGMDVSAFDFSPTAIDLLRTRIPSLVRVEVAELSEFTSPNGFDLVCCIDVLFHVVDDTLWTKAVLHLESMVMAGGRLIVQEHLVDSGSESLGPHVRWRSLAMYEDVLNLELLSHERYEIPAEGSYKDLLVWRRQS